MKKKVIINGAAKEIGRAAVLAVTKARGMEVAGAVDSYLIGEDIGKVFCVNFSHFLIFINFNIISCDNFEFYCPNNFIISVGL